MLSGRSGQLCAAAGAPAAATIAIAAREALIEGLFDALLDDLICGSTGE
jgi:hypothetical protein